MSLLQKFKNFGQTFLEIVACVHLTTNITVLTFGCLLIYIALLFSSYWYVALIYTVWYVYDWETPYRSGRKIHAIRNFFLWRYLASYFPISLHKTADLDPSKNYLFAFHPHGVFVIGGATNFATNATGFDEKFPGLNIHFSVLNGQFKFPFYREYAIFAGFSPSEARTIEYKLTKMGPGSSVFLVVGGAAELVYSIYRKSYTLRLKNRKGFIRTVLKTGASLVPVFSFNEHRIYGMLQPKKWTFLWFIQQFIRCLTSLTIPFAFGRSYCLHFLPRRRPIDTVVGAPIDFAEFRCKFQPGEDPPEDVVDKCYQVYVDALTKLYDDHKARFGDENTPLILA